jgi:hypothetical protein
MLLQEIMRTARDREAAVITKAQNKKFYRAVSLYETLGGKIETK